MNKETVTATDHLSCLVCVHVCWSAPLQQGRHMLFHLAGVCQRAGQDHPSGPSLHLVGWKDLKHHVTYLLQHMWFVFRSNPQARGGISTFMYILHLSKRNFHFIVVRSASVKLANSSVCNTGNGNDVYLSQSTDKSVMKFQLLLYFISLIIHFLNVSSFSAIFLFLWAANVSWFFTHI